MKKLIYLSVFIGLIHLLACDPPAIFTEPQPTDTKNLREFPKRLKGQYLSIEDNSILAISDSLILRVYDYDYKMHPNELDSNSRLSGDTLIDLNTKEKSIIKREGDSIITHIHSVDTLFQLNYDNVVRKFKGYYFLNTRLLNVKEGWEVKKVKLSKGKLTVSSISAKEDIQTLEAITETPQDTLKVHRFKPTKKQFRQFIKKEGFSDSEVYVKIN